MNRDIWIPYCGVAPGPADWISRWNFDPALLAIFALSAIALGVWHNKKSTGTNLKASGGILVLAVFLFVSPFCALGSALFTVRILHDTILSLLLGPLIMTALRLQNRRISGTLPLWTAIHLVIFWLWHAPPIYALAMSSSSLFWLMQLSIAGSAALWWAKLLRSPAAAGSAAILATMVGMGVLGALITFANRALYAPHWLATRTWGLTPLEDQQIAGIIMWAPVSAVYLLVALVLLYRSLEAATSPKALL